VYFSPDNRLIKITKKNLFFLVSCDITAIKPAKAAGHQCNGLESAQWLGIKLSRTPCTLICLVPINRKGVKE
jgi:hypothetical protein